MFDYFRLDRYYLAYGSNLSVRRMQTRCPYAVITGTAYIPDCALRFRKSQTGFYATVDYVKGETVPAVVWRLSAYDELLLDGYEGCPKHYQKVLIKLPIRFFRDSKKRRREAMLYVLPEERPLGAPTQEYLDIILKGYLHGTFPLNSFLKDLRRR